MAEETTDRRAARRFTMSLPLQVRFEEDGSTQEKSAHTRDISFRGVYFLMDAPLPEGTSIELVVTLPQQITLAGEVRIRCFASVVRVESREDLRGIAAKIDCYEFLPAAA